MKTIIWREFLDHVRSLQFVVLLVLTVILFAANGFIFVKSYEQRIATYQKQSASMEELKSTVQIKLYRRPNSLLFVAEGGDINKPSEYYLYPKGVFSAGEQNLRAFKLPTVPALDWSLIIGTLFSLYAILLGYGTVSLEKEQGTLRLILSNPLSRIRLLAAKYLSVLSIIAITLLIGTLVSLIIMGTLAPQILTQANVGRIILVFLLALAYISLFVFLSLFLSSIISRSSMVLLTLLALWVFFAIIIPGSSGVLIDKFSSAPREVQATRMYESLIHKEVWGKIQTIAAKAKRGEFKTEAELKAATDQAFEDGETRLNEFNEEIDRANRQKSRSARNLARLSPAALFQYAAESLIQSGSTGEDRFLEQLREHSRVYDAYILKKLGKVVISQSSYSEEFDFQGKTIIIESQQAQEYQGDKSDFPKFEERRPSVGEGLKSALGDLAGLILWNIVLAGLAFAAFIRMDVR